MYDYLVVGAGLYGAVFSYIANKNGKKVAVIDRRNHIAGNIYTENKYGITVHKYGAHIFHTSNEEVYKFFGKFGNMKQFINSPLAKYNDELYNLPFNMNTFNKLWGVITPNEAKEKIKAESGIYSDIEPKNLKEQAMKLVGREIYEKLIEGYTEKQWGRSCEELSPDIIKRIPLRFTYDNNYFNDVYQCIPENGYTEIVENMLSGTDVYLNQDYKDCKINAKFIVYTGGIDEFFDYCYGALEYRSLDFELEEIECDDFQGNAVVNYTDRYTPFTRIIEHKHFLKESSSKTIISKEYPKDFVVGEDAYYPINNERNIKLYNMYLDKANKLKNIHFGGRLGMYKYFDMDDTIMAALDFARERGYKC